MAVLIAIPILGGLALIQSAIVSRMPLILGTADLVLITIIAWALQERIKGYWQWSIIGGGIITFMSALPVGIYIGAYLGATFLARLISRRVWKVPFLGMLVATFLGTLLLNVTAWLSRWLLGVFIPIDQALNLVVIPGILLNMVLAVPVYFVVKDLAAWLYPEEIEA
jgi:Na+/phosphate symporter